MRLFADTTPLRSPDFRRLWFVGFVVFRPCRKVVRTKKSPICIPAMMADTAELSSLGWALSDSLLDSRSALVFPNPKRLRPAFLAPRIRTAQTSAMRAQSFAFRSTEPIMSPLSRDMSGIWPSIPDTRTSVAMVGGGTL